MPVTAYRRVSALLLLLILSGATTATANGYFLAEVTLYPNNTTTLHSIDTATNPGFNNTAPENASYTAHLLDRDGNTLATTPLSFPFLGVSAVPHGGHHHGTTDGAETKRILLPYNSSGETFVLTRDDAELLRADIPMQLCRADTRCLPYCGASRSDPDCQSTTTVDRATTWVQDHAISLAAVFFTGFLLTFFLGIRRTLRASKGAL